MKSEHGLQRSILASLKTAVRANTGISDSLTTLVEIRHDIGNVMPDLRTQLAELTKAVHELNAYHNCLTTE